MTIRLLAFALAFLPLILLGQYDSYCCIDATCSDCSHIQQCLNSPIFSIQDASIGGAAVCGINHPTTSCTTFWENNIHGVTNEIPATQWNPSGCFVRTCGDPLASNYDPIYGPFAPEDFQNCVYAPTNPDLCLDGTVWDENLGGCIIENPTDTDLDGCTGVDDVLNVLATFGMCYEDNSSSIPEEYYSDSDVLLLLDFNGETIDKSSAERSVTLSNYQLGVDRFGNTNSALHPLSEMPELIQGSCSEVIVNGETPNNCVVVAPPVTILGTDNDAFGVSMWIEHPTKIYSDGCYQSIWSSLLYGLVPIDNPPAGNTTVCYYASDLSFSLENWGWEDQACPYSSLNLNGWGMQGASWQGDTCFSITDSPDVLPQHPYQTGWNHLAISKNNNQVEVYINGNVQWTATLNEDEQDSFRHYGALGFPNITISNHDLVVELIRGIREGLSQSTHYYSLDDILILNRSLSSEDIAQLYTPGPELNITGCTACDACNYNGVAIADDGTCDYSCYGCLDANACNFDQSATLTNNSCYFPGDTCSDGNDLTCGDVYNSACECAGISPTNSNGFGPCDGLENVTYFGHDYPLIEICGHCWFAENLRTSQFQNGDIIPTVCGVGNNSTLCSGTGHSLTIPDYGGQYNYWAYTDDRGLCPSGFHVPSLSEWEDLHAAVITELPEGESAANSLRGSISDFPAWTGSDLFGFSAIPAGSNCHTGNLGTFAEFATSSVVQSVNWNAVHGIYINDTGNGIGGVSGGVHNGWCRNVSVRCVKD